MGYKQPNNPMKMMKSALKMHKDEKKSGMHRDSAMYMGHSPMEMGHDSPAKNMNKGYGQEVKSPMKRESAELKDMPIVDIEKGDAKGSPAKGVGGMTNHRNFAPEGTWEKHKAAKHSGSPAKGVGGMTNHRNFEPEGTWEKHKAAKHSGSPAKMKKDSPMEKELVGKQKNLPEALKAKIEAAPESPAKMGHKKGSPAKKYDRVVLGGNKGDKSKTKPGKKDYKK